VDGERLQPELRRAAYPRGGARRSVRAEEALRRRTGLFAAASAACALAPEVGWLVAARAVQGAGAAMVLTLGLALLSAAFPPEKRGAAVARAHL
jgi:MFS family permease